MTILKSKTATAVTQTPASNLNVSKYIPFITFSKLPVKQKPKSFTVAIEALDAVLAQKRHN